MAHGITRAPPKVVFLWNAMLFVLCFCVFSLSPKCCRQMIKKEKALSEAAPNPKYTMDKKRLTPTVIQSQNQYDEVHDTPRSENQILSGGGMPPLDRSCWQRTRRRREFIFGARDRPVHPQRCMFCWQQSCVTTSLPAQALAVVLCHRQLVVTE